MSLLPCWWGKQRPEWLKTLPEVKKKKKKKSFGLQGRILTRQLKKKKKKVEPTCHSSLRYHERHQQTFPHTLACHLAGQAP